MDTSKKNKQYGKQIVVPKFGEILNERPKGMGYETYRQKRKEQCLRLKGFGHKVMDANGKASLTHIFGRLESAVRIPSNEYVNGRNPYVIVK